MSVNLFRLRMTCQRDPSAIELLGGPEELVAEFDPMPYAECESLYQTVIEYLERPNDWKPTILPCDNEGCRA